MKYTLLTLTFIMSLSSFAQSDAQSSGGSNPPAPIVPATVEEAQSTSAAPVPPSAPAGDPKQTEALFLGEPGSGRCTNCEKRMQTPGKRYLGDKGKSPQARGAFIPGTVKKKKKPLVSPADQKVEK